jgi:hypothetical protein
VTYIDIARTPCPHCGAEMEPIDNGAEGAAFHQLRLCPECYLVVWNDEDGLQLRQGVPVRTGHEPRPQAVN